MVPEDLCMQLAFAPDVEQEFQQMFEDLSNRVEEASLAHQNSDGGIQPSKQRRRTRARVLEGLQIDNITLKIERDKREKSGLLVRQSPIDVMPAEAVQWLAEIDGATRSWLNAHNERIVAHGRWLRSSAAAREISRQDVRINNSEDAFPGVASISNLAAEKLQIGRPVTKKRALALTFCCKAANSGQGTDVIVKTDEFSAVPV